MDKRKFNGGHSTGGRKKKEEEQLLIEMLSPFDNLYIDTLIQKIKEGEAWAVKEFSNRRWGRPREAKDVDLTLNGEMTLSQLSELSYEERKQYLSERDGINK